MHLANWLPLLLMIAWLLPLASFATILLGHSRRRAPGTGPTKRSMQRAGTLALGSIGASFVLSLIGLIAWLILHPLGDADPGSGATYTGTYLTLVRFGDLRLTLSYYIDGLTLLMFTLVTLVSAAVHYYATGYMATELEPVVDHEATTLDGGDLIRPGRYHRFFQYLSLFSFSMLGIVLAGNLAMMFIFWELVGISSYLLIGFYFERPRASRAANKAVLMNRIGDVGMLIGLMALWTSLGTLELGDGSATPAAGGIFSQIAAWEPTDSAAASGQSGSLTYPLLMVAGLGIFAGAIGKSAQFPLLTWLPDAMEGPTPVSALVHSATMVAAGVFLVARCYPLLVPEVLLVIAVVGCVTLLLAATMALVAVDIKRVLAYSTISQLGYMMLALGLGGWAAGLFHLVTHALFKSLLFLGAGSVIHATGTNDLHRMGGLRHKMPFTAWTMLVGCLAIVGAGVPGFGGVAGFYSKDAIIEQAWSFASANPGPGWSLLLWVPVLGAILTALYTFRLWFLAFAAPNRDAARYQHAHESPPSMVIPLMVLAVLAVVGAWGIPFTSLSLANLLDSTRPAHLLATSDGEWLTGMVIPDEHASHTPAIREGAGWTALAASALGVFAAALLYAWRSLHSEEIRTTFRPLHTLLLHGWWLDELYQVVAVRPVLLVGRAVAMLDRYLIDPLIHLVAWIGRQLARLLDRLVDRRGIDGGIDAAARGTWQLGLALRHLQTGHLRQYVATLVAGTLGMFAIASLIWKYAIFG